MKSPGNLHAANSPTGFAKVDGGLSAWIEGRVSARPDAVALTSGSERLTYTELNTRSNRLAARLRELGIGPDVLVGVHFDRTFDLIVSILAVLKAGGAYLPLDLACPEDRLAYMLQDSSAPVLLTQSAYAEKFAEYRGTLLCLDHEAEALDALDSNNVPSAARPEHLAYVIYTSGSTGLPKGCLVTQANVMRLFTATDPWFHFNGDDVWTLFHSSAFDFSVWEIFGALLYGGRLVLVPYMVSRSATEFRQLLLQEGVTVLNQTPSAFRQLTQADSTHERGGFALRYVIFGGEALEFQSLRPWFDRYGDSSPRLVNMYGITETTVHVTYRVVTRADLDAGSGSNIGVPIPDLQVHVVDSALKPVADGEAGEMLVGGLGVARGYLNRADLTAQRFIVNPFESGKSERLYRSGDLARRLPNGDLEYLGRIDHQVKIRGFRIEIGEIESQLARHPGVRECAVLARADAQSEVRLVAYIVPGADAPAVEHLRAHLALKLPEYMVPAAYVFVPGFPLTVNGKLDRDGLPAPTGERPNLAAAYAAPENELERLLANLWKSALRQKQVGLDDNFFDLGADSLLLTHVHRQLEAALQRHVPITELFANPTVRRLAAKLAAPEQADGLANKTQARAQAQRAAAARHRKPASTT
jgi:amino acid adenylation domain-containing protein